MRKIFVIMTNSFSKLSYLILILCILIYVLALIGYNLFSDAYNQSYSSSKMPRYLKIFHVISCFFLIHTNLYRFNFVDFGHSLLMIFRILCGDTTDALQFLFLNFFNCK